MLQNPYEHLIKLCKANNIEAKESSKFVFEKFDSISLWTIGLSIGSISLFLSNIKDIKPVIRTHGIYNLNTIFLLLFISVVCGILYRIVFLWSYIQLDSIFKGMDISFSDEYTMDTESVLTGEEDFNQMCRQVSQYYDIPPQLFSDYNKASDEIKRKIMDSLVSDYHMGVSHANKLKLLALDRISDIYSSYLPISKKKLISNFVNPNNYFRNKFRYTNWLWIALYIIFMCSFLIALAIFLLITQ